jgi:hypothetical protein
MKKPTVFESVRKIKANGDVSGKFEAEILIAGRLRGEFIEKGLRMRTCHVCREIIPKGDEHVGIHSKLSSGFQTRRNLCIFCVDTLSKLLKQKVAWRKKLKKRVFDRLIDAI